MPELETKDMSAYEMGSWLSQNLHYMENIERDLKLMDSRKDALPKGFNPMGILLFLTGAVNEVKRVTALNQALTQALKTASKPVAEEK